MTDHHSTVAALATNSLTASEQAAAAETEAQTQVQEASATPTNQSRLQQAAKQQERERKEFQLLLAKPPVAVIIRLLEQAQTYTSPYRAMSDIFDRFLEIANFCLDGRGQALEALSQELQANPALAAQVDPGEYALLLIRYQKRVSEWHSLVKGFSKQSMRFFKQALSVLLYHSGINQDYRDYRDYIGEVYMELGQSNKWAGQFFTPFDVAFMMSQINLGDVAEWPQDQPLTINDPACGSGVMLLGAAAVVAATNPLLIERGLLELSGQDIDRTCVLMAELNLRLHGLDSWSCMVKRQAWQQTAGEEGQQLPGQAQHSRPAPLEERESVKLYNALTEGERLRLENTTRQRVAELEASLLQTRQLLLEGFAPGQFFNPAPSKPKEKQPGKATRAATSKAGIRQPLQPSLAFGLGWEGQHITPIRSRKKRKLQHE